MYCRHCGIEVMNDTSACPICGSKLGSEPAVSPAALYPDPAVVSGESPFARRIQASLIVVLILMVPALITGITDWFAGAGLTWSRYVLASLGWTGLCTVAVLLLRAFPLAAFVLNAFTGAVFLAVLNGFTGGEPWAAELGIPLLLFTVCAVLVFWFVADRLRPSGSVCAGSFLAVVSSMLIAYEAQIRCYISVRGGGECPGGFLGRLVWSPIVAAVLFPLAGIFFIIHFIMKRSESARRIFHW